MIRQSERITLPNNGAGTDKYLLKHRFKPKSSSRKAYIQASLHAGETPGMLVAHHLLEMLDNAAQEGAIINEIVIVPYANPLGLSQWLNDEQLGRYSFMGDGNFNRNWPRLDDLAEDDISENILSQDRDHNIRAIRQAFRKALTTLSPLSDVAALRVALATDAVDADLVLDLHCDDEALMHLFQIPDHWPESQDIVCELGCHAVLLAEDSGGASFDEAFSTPWLRLAEKFPGKPVPAACHSFTVELRGQGDVSDELAAQDAKALYRILQRRGFITGEAGPLPKALCEPSKLEATDTIKSPKSGIIAYKVDIGTKVKKGDIVAEIVDPAAEKPGSARTGIQAQTDGLVISRCHHKYARSGSSIMKIVGKEPLAYRTGYLLED